MNLKKHLLPASYGLLAVVVALIGLGYGLSTMWPVYVGVGLYLVAVLVYVLPAAAGLINARENVGGVVASLVLALAFTPAALGVGGAYVATQAALAVFDDIGEDFNDDFGSDIDPDLGGDPRLEDDGTDLTEPPDYSDATTVEECDEIWLEDFSDTAYESQQACYERVS